MTRKTYAGILPAFPTPTYADGSVNRAALARLVNALIDKGADGLVPVGGTGEFTALSARGRRDAVEATIQAADGRVPVIAGVLSPGFADAVDVGAEFRAAGADALLLIAPFYVTPTQAGIRGYFNAYREKVDIDILLYDIPGRTRIVVDPETIALAEEDGAIVGMKACNPDVYHFHHIATAVSPRFALLSGEDTHFPLHMAMGAKGGILATASLVAERWVRIYKRCLENDFRAAMALHRELLPLIDAIFTEPNPGPLKVAMQMVGYPAGDVLSPLVAPCPDTVARLKQALDGLREHVPA